MSNSNSLDIDARQISNFSSVIYLAQSRRYKEFPSGIPEVNLVNNVAPLKLADISEKLGIPFVYCSTGSVYSPTKATITETSKLVDDMNMTSYIASKLFAEQTLIERMKGQEIIILRPFFMYGEGARTPALFPSLVNEIKSKKAVTLKGFSGLRFNPISSFDASRAICHLLMLGENGVFNLSGVETVSLREVCILIANQLETKAGFIEVDGDQVILNDQSKLLSTGFKYLSEFKEAFSFYVKNSSTIG